MTIKELMEKKVQNAYNKKGPKGWHLEIVYTVDKQPIELIVTNEGGVTVNRERVDHKSRLLNNDSGDWYEMGTGTPEDVNKDKAPLEFAGLPKKDPGAPNEGSLDVLDPEGTKQAIPKGSSLDKEDAGASVDKNPPSAQKKEEAKVSPEVIKDNSKKK